MLAHIDPAYVVQLFADTVSINLLISVLLLLYDLF